MTRENEPLRVFVLEDDAPTREHLRALLHPASGFTCVGEAANAKQALNLLPELRPDVVLVDLELPGIDGTSFIRAARAHHAHLRLLVLTNHDGAGFLFPALTAGADGYLLKGGNPAVLLAGIREVHGGGAPMSASIARKVLQHFQAPAGRVTEEQGLSPREIDILTLLSRGLQQKEIAEQLGLAPRTVSTHLGHIYHKLHVHNAAGAVAVFLQQEERSQ